MEKKHSVPIEQTKQENEIGLPGREKFEIPKLFFVPIKIEERLMQGTCSNTASGFGCTEPFKLS